MISVSLRAEVVSLFGGDGQHAQHGRSWFIASEDGGINEVERLLAEIDVARVLLETLTRYSEEAITIINLDAAIVITFRQRLPGLLALMKILSPRRDGLISA